MKVSPSFAASLLFFLSWVLVLPSALGSPNSGLLAHWTFDDGSASDTTGRGHDAEPVGGPLVLAPDFDGLALVLDGATYLEVPAHPDLGMTSSTVRTVALWANAASIPNVVIPGAFTAGLISNYVHFNVGSSNYYAAVNLQDEIFFASLTGRGTDLLTAEGGSLNTWQHYAFVLDSSAAASRIYLDGVLIGTGSLQYNLMASSQPLRIGTIVGAGSPQTFDGRLDDIRIYDRALSPEEIEDLATICLFAPQEDLTFTRTVGPPRAESIVWESCGGAGRLILDSQDVAAAVVALNGEVLAGPERFRSGSQVFEVPMTLEPGVNLLEVELRGKPGGTLILTLEPL